MPPRWLIWLALGIVYVIWGTTYLGIRITNETLPPLIAAGTRFVIAGAVLFAVSTRRRDAEADPIGRPQWLAALLVGAGLIAFGNGSVVLAERTVPSGTVALIFALVPLWIALWDRFVGSPPAPGPGRDRHPARFHGRRAARERRALGRRAALRAAARGRRVDELGRRFALRPRARGSRTVRSSATRW